MIISLKRRKLRADFPYNTIIIEVCRRLGGKWNKTDRIWEFNINDIINIVDVLSSMGFDVEESVRQEYDRIKSKLATVEKIRDGFISPADKAFLDSTPLREYQKIGVSFMNYNAGTLLGDEPGCGKTLSVLTLFKIMNASRMLIVCPSSLKYSWVEQITTWYPDIKYQVIEGVPKKRSSQWSQDVNIFIVNYELLIKDYLLLDDFDIIAVDEAVRLANPKNKLLKALKKIKSKKRVAMTGTPMNNRIQDIWGIMEFVEPGYLGSFSTFTNRYCVKNDWGSIISYKNLDHLKQSIRHYMIRRLKTDILTELPDKIYINIYTEFSDDERKLYRYFQQSITSDLIQNNSLACNNKINVLSSMTRLRQIADSTSLVSTLSISTKTESLKELLAEIIVDNKKAIVFTEFAEMAKLLADSLSIYNPLLFIGEIDNVDRDDIIHKFKEDDKYQLLIATSCGSSGLNLQRACYVIHYDMPWSISKTLQREDRAHRLGQKDSVVIYRMLVKGSIDEYMLDILNRKENMSKDLLQDKQHEYNTINITDNDIHNILDV